MQCIKTGAHIYIDQYGEFAICNAESTRNKHGKAVMRLRFESFEALEAYFADELIGSDMMEGSASKVIGTTLLIWDRN